ncbi:Na+/H+ antiporter NhaC [Geodermatophilus telluris]|uniref:Na+/H+ antiporter NhaC n=1 Tax=Geodermatophilus telluris TaxID=1190417 RepID=A0A1G6QJZ5_9ACTN|nr:Na+/H+ antiporter NhaC family protein [Geodermatophilus telluris]SDC92772.1 Na+/H+ antiporter NhaC [Geodermatophilus telluris]
MTTDTDLPTGSAPTPTGTSFRTTAVRHRDLAVYTALAAVVGLVAVAAPHGGDWYGAWSLLPAVTLFGFILVTHRVLEGFLWASALALFMSSRGDVFTAWVDRLYQEVSNTDNLWLLVLLLCIGGLIGVVDHLGLAASFADRVARLARGRRRSALVTLAATAALSNDSYLSSSGVGVSMTPVNRRFGIPRAYSAMLIRSTAEPLCTLNPIGSTPVLIAGLLVTAGAATAATQVSTYGHLMTYLFFPMAVVVVAVLAGLGVIPPLGAMRREMSTGTVEDVVEAEAAEPVSALTERSGRRPHWLNLVVTVGTVIVGSLVTGDVQKGFILSLLVTGIVLIVQRIATPASYLDAAVEGMKDIFSLVLLMAIAFVLVSGIADLQFAEFVIQNVSEAVPAAWLPFVVFLAFGLTEALVTLNWSLYILLVPVLITLADQMGANPLATVAALVSAGTWGITTAISSDVGLLTSSSTEVPLFRHWITNLPYQVIAFVLALAGYAVLGLVGS